MKRPKASVHRVSVCRTIEPESNVFVQRASVCAKTVERRSIEQRSVHIDRRRVRLSRAFLCVPKTVGRTKKGRSTSPRIVRRSSGADRARPSDPPLASSPPPLARKGVCHASHTSIRVHESRGAAEGASFIKSAAARVAAGRDALDDTPSARGASSTAADVVPLRQRRATTRRARPPRRRAPRRATARRWRATTAKATTTTTTSARSTSSRSATRTSRSPRRDSMIYISLSLCF